MFGLTASPLLSLERNQKIQNLEENLILLCQNLDSIFLEYDQKTVNKFLKESKSSVTGFPNGPFLQTKGESFLRFIENQDEKDGSFEEFIQREPYLSRIFQYFTDKVMSVTVAGDADFSLEFKEIVQEVDHYLRKKTLRILYELG